MTGAAQGPSSPRGPYRAAGVPGRWRAVACGGSLLAGLVLAGCGGGEAPATTPPPAAPAPAASATAASPAAAVTVTSVDIGPELAPGGRTTRPAIRFAPGDTIHAVASIAAPDTGAPHTGRLVARWTYGDGQPVAETGHDFGFSGQATVYFSVAHPGGWPPGDYRLEVFLDGELVQTRGFEVR